LNSFTTDGFLLKEEMKWFKGLSDLTNALDRFGGGSHYTSQKLGHKSLALTPEQLGLPITTNWLTGAFSTLSFEGTEVILA
jgi:hypothetical protein